MSLGRVLVTSQMRPGAGRIGDVLNAILREYLSWYPELVSVSRLQDKGKKLSWLPDADRTPELPIKSNFKR